MPKITEALNLNDLPAPPLGKVGWPWTEQSELLPENMPDGSEWPRISIVTPSYNQGQFIEETIRSVLLQGYPRLELIVIDGGSTDSTVDILRKYNRFISYWVSEEDRGQTHALNKGFRKAQGQLIGWQNSDDVYGKGIFREAALVAKNLPLIDIFYGCVEQRDDSGALIRMYPTSNFEVTRMIPFLNMCNQSMFFRRHIFDSNNYLDESFKHAMDLEFFVRLALNSLQFRFIPALEGVYRIHPDAKGSKQQAICMVECLKVYEYVYFHSHASLALKEKAFASAYGLTLDAFAKGYLHEFRDFAKEIFRLRFFSRQALSILPKYVLSYLGVDMISNLKRRLYPYRYSN